MKWHLTKNELPEEQRLVVIYIPNRPWIWHGKGDIHYKIAWLEKSLWYEFGPACFRTQEVKAWAYFEEFKEGGK